MVLTVQMQQITFRASLKWLIKELRSILHIVHSQLNNTGEQSIQHPYTVRSDIIRIYVVKINKSLQENNERVNI